jgi:sugar transferase (PEP-CTERM/EpsH1 system associated)
MLDFFNNGVDAGFFDPQLSFDNPFGRDKKVIVFTGAMDYWANVDAVRWFVEKVLPTVQNQQPETQFIIVGSNPTEEVTALGQHPGVRVTGRVEDIRPYLRHANLAVAPLRIARGVQNKVLEAMSMATPVVATPAAMEGIAHCETYRPVIAQAAHEFAQACIRLLDSSAEESRAPAARECIKRHYDWDTNLDRVGVHLGVASGRRHDGQEAVG